MHLGCKQCTFQGQQAANPRENNILPWQRNGDLENLPFQGRAPGEIYKERKSPRLKTQAKWGFSWVWMRFKCWRGVGGLWTLTDAHGSNVNARRSPQGACNPCCQITHPSNLCPCKSRAALCWLPLCCRRWCCWVLLQPCWPALITTHHDLALLSLAQLMILQQREARLTARAYMQIHCTWANIHRQVPKESSR